MQNWPPDKAQWCEQNCNVIFIQLHFYSSYLFNFLRLLSQWNHTVLNSEWSAVFCYYKPQILGPTFLIYVLKWSVILTSLALKNGVKNIKTAGYNCARMVNKYQFSNCNVPKRRTTYLSALDFCNSRIWNIKFEFYRLCTADRKILFKLGTNKVHQTQYLRLENCKNQVQINRGLGFILFFKVWFL